MGKTTQSFQRIVTRLADLYAEGLNVQTVNDLFTMYVGAASQHVLRASALCLNKRLKTLTNRLSPIGPASCAVTLLRCFFYLSSLVDLEWDLLFNEMQLHHDVRGSRSFLD